MTTLTDHLLAYPRGRRYSHIVRVRGLPYAFSDGRVDWTTFANVTWGVSVKPLLAKSDWSFKFESNPLEPLAVGSGTAVEILNDPGGLAASLFAPMKSMDFELTILQSAVQYTTTIIGVDSSAPVSEGTPLYWGLETMKVVAIDGNDLTVERGAFGSPVRRNQEYSTRSNFTYTDGSSGLIPMPPLTSHPDVWRGRYVEIRKGVIEDDGTLGESWPIWAGRLESFSLDGAIIKLNVEPLTAAITKDNWPRAMPKGSLRSDTVKLFIQPEDLYLWVNIIDSSGAFLDSGNRYPMGTYSTANPAVFSVYSLSAGTYVTLEHLARMIQDTIIYATRTGPGAGSSYDDVLWNNLTVSVARTGADDEVAVLTLQMRNETALTFSLNVNKGIMKALVNAMLAEWGQTALLFSASGVWEIPPHGETVYGAFGRNSGYILAQDGKFFQVVPDDGAYTFNEARGGCYHLGETEMRGYLRIAQGDEAELVAFSATAEQADGSIGIELEERGLGWTRVRAWGVGADETTVEQVAVVHTGESMALADVVLFLLTSTGAEESPGYNGSYDYLGEWVGLGIPEELVDREGIKARLAVSDMPRPFMFWVPEAGKGKDAVEELLRANGVYLTTRRYIRDNVEYFGLSVDVVDAPTQSEYTIELTDSDVSANRKPRVDINERLIINHICVVPRFSYSRDADDAVSKRYERDDDSIAKYGQAKTLELSPAALFNVFSSNFAGNYSDREQVADAIAHVIGLRWFGAFSRGNYTLRGETPHIGWKYQTGDRVLLVLTGVPNPDGSNSYASLVAKIDDVTHKHGSNASGDITLRLSTTQPVELAPCFTVASVSGAEITLTSTGYVSGDHLNNPFSWVTINGPLAETAIPSPHEPFNYGTGAAADWMWFDPENHTDGNGLRIRLWPRGNHALGEEFEVLSISGGVLTLGASPSSTLLEASITPTGSNAAVPLLGTLGEWDDPSTLTQSYAFAASNAVAPTIYAYPPKKWS